MKIRTDIIVPTFGQEDYTLRCFESLRKCTDDYRLVWVDNASSTVSRQRVMKEFLKHPNRLPVWNDDNLAFVGGVNVALELLHDVYESEAEYVVILNNDTEVTKKWLDRMIYVMETNKRVMAVGPLTSTDGSWQGYNNALPRLGADKVPESFEKMTHQQRNDFLWNEYGHRYRPVEMIAFFCTVFRRSVFDLVGRLDTRFGLGFGDDDDYCRMIKKLGHLVAVAYGVYVFHNHRTTFRSRFSSEEIQRQQDKNMMLYRKKHGI